MRKVSVSTHNISAYIIRVIAAFNLAEHISESSFGFERVWYVTKRENIINTPLYGNFNWRRKKETRILETDSLFDFPLQTGLERVMLVRDNALFRLVAWGGDRQERYKLYTRDFEQFCDAVERLTDGKLRPTEKLWSAGNIINIVGDEARPATTPLTDDFERGLIEIIRNHFERAIANKIYGVADSEVFAALANIEYSIASLHNAAHMFTPLKADFENSVAHQVGISDFQI